MIRATARFVPSVNIAQWCETRLRQPLTSAIQAGCSQIEAAAKEYCPVDTGALQNSIASEVHDTDNGVEGSVFAGVFYAPYVEFGTGIRGAESSGAGPGPYTESWPGMVAQPYMRPALDENKAAVLDLIETGIGEALRAA